MFILIMMFRPYILSVSENTSFILGNGKLVTPPKPAAEVTPNRCMSDAFQSPLNFSTVTVEQLGITPESFVKNSSGKRCCSSIAVPLKVEKLNSILFTYPVYLITLSKLIDSQTCWIREIRVPGHPA